MENKKVYSECVEDLIARFGFDKFLIGEQGFVQWANDMSDALYDNGFCWASGACRVVIFHDEWDFVLKFTYDKEDLIDYCRNEDYLYAKAKAWGVEQAFASCEYVGRFALYDIYVMDRCYCNEDGMSDDSYDLQYKKYCSEYGLDPNEDGSMEEFSNCCPEYEDQDCMLELAAEHWGEQFARKVIDFIYEFGINDCHCGNWGWINDRLVIVDYAGYGDFAKAIRNRRIKECGR